MEKQKEGRRDDDNIALRSQSDDTILLTSGCVRHTLKRTNIYMDNFISCFNFTLLWFLMWLFRLVLGGGVIPHMSL